MARFVVVGEALVDIVAPADGGAHLPRPGGSPLNVAVGLGRLGHEVVLVTRIGDDPHGELVRSHVEDSGVQLAPGSVVPGTRTSTALARLDASGAADYTFELSWDLDAAALPDGVDAVHVGSLGTLLQPGAAAVREIVAEARAAGALVSYDPNVRRALVTEPASYVRDVTAWAASAHVVKASSDDVAFLAEHGDVRWSSPFVAVTHGADGISVATPASWQVRPARVVDVVDTIGAGDSFMAGLLDGLARVDALDVTTLPRLQGDVVAAVADHAALAAALTCTRAGADPPRRAELDAATAADVTE